MTINWFTIRSAVIASIGGYAFGIDGGTPASHSILVQLHLREPNFLTELERAQVSLPRQSAMTRSWTTCFRLLARMHPYLVGYPLVPWNTVCSSRQQEQLWPFTALGVALEILS